MFAADWGGGGEGAVKESFLETFFFVRMESMPMDGARRAAAVRRGWGLSAFEPARTASAGIGYFNRFVNPLQERERGGRGVL